MGFEFLQLNRILSMKAAVFSIRFIFTCTSNMGLFILHSRKYFLMRAVPLPHIRESYNIKYLHNAISVSRWVRFREH